MSWRAKLQEQRGAVFQKGQGDPLTQLTQPQNGRSDSLTKLTKPSCVSSVSDPSGNSANIGAAVLLDAPALKQLRARLLALAGANWIDAASIHRLHDLDVAACIGLDSRQLAGYLSLLEETAERHAGRVPAGHTAAIHCQLCGPVWAYPDVAAVLPVVDGWPRALGCPWCFVRKAGGYIPRPPVACEGCRHFTPDTISPAAGMGACGAGKGTQYPMQRRGCSHFHPIKKATL
ncbi:hypothetical protein [Rhodanobacter sp. MP1X3]|uniref:hypothetical protein n=1 Tax=Rhodanobacter sp. MP1X3 TaxID=2723086 RepID=UPI00161C7308|nr:hypothetical protein [Rhodanobacter sp. MP1X3]MBB6243077.1 hypothetical protein [Rhodanobacter sp. MP1X3]